MSPATHHTRVRFRHHSSWVGPLREVCAAHPTVQIRVVVDDLSLQRFGVRTRLLVQIAPSRVQASKAELNFGIDFASGQRASTWVR